MSAPGRTSTPPPERLAAPAPRPQPMTGAFEPPNTLALSLAAFNKRKRLIVALPLVFSLIAVALVIPRPRFYLARAAFIASEPQSMSGSLGALSSVASQLGVPALSAVASSSATGSAQFYGDLLNSTAIAHSVITTTYDANTPGDYGGRPFR